MKDLKNTSDKDLSKELSKRKQTLSSFRFGIAGSKSKNVREGRNLRKDAARILTEINKRKK